MRRVRKTAWAAVFLVSFFIVIRLASLQRPATPPSDLPVSLSLSDQDRDVLLVICRNIVDGKPFGEDSLFDEHSAIYAYSRIDSSAREQVKHRWYRDTVLVLQFDCPPATACVSRLGEVIPGEWSLDLMSGNELLATRQFRVERRASYP